MSGGASQMQRRWHRPPVAAVAWDGRSWPPAETGKATGPAGLDASAPSTDVGGRRAGGRDPLPPRRRACWPLHVWRLCRRRWCLETGRAVARPRRPMCVFVLCKQARTRTAQRRPYEHCSPLRLAGGTLPRGDGRGAMAEGRRAMAASDLRRRRRRRTAAAVDTDRALSACPARNVGAPGAWSLAPGFNLHNVASDLWLRVLSGFWVGACLPAQPAPWLLPSLVPVRAAFGCRVRKSQARPIPRLPVGRPGRRFGHRVCRRPGAANRLPCPSLPCPVLLVPVLFLLCSARLGSPPPQPVHIIRLIRSQHPHPHPQPRRVRAGVGTRIRPHPQPSATAARADPSKRRPCVRATLHDSPPPPPRAHPPLPPSPAAADCGTAAPGS